MNGILKGRESEKKLVRLSRQVIATSKSPIRVSESAVSAAGCPGKGLFVNSLNASTGMFILYFVAGNDVGMNVRVLAT